MADIKDFYNAKNIVALWEQIKGANYAKPLAKWFPYRKTTEVDITLAYGYEKQNVALDLCAYDTNARIRGLQPISAAKMEMPFFKNSVLFTEKQRREVLQTVKFANNDLAIATALAGHMENVVDILLNGPDVVGERYRAQLLQHGAIVVSSPKSHVSPSAVSINYDVRGKWQDNNVDYWVTKPSQGTTNVLDDMQPVMDEYQKKNGSTPCSWIMNGRTWLNLRKDTRINAILTANGFNKSVEQVIQDVLGQQVSIVVNSGTYRPDEDEPELPYWEEDVISIVPNRQLGHVLVGLTPTQYDEMYSEAKRDVASSSENFCIQCRHRDDPIQTEAIGSTTMLPQFDEMDKCFVIRPE